MQNTLRRLEEEVPLLAIRVAELSPERQESAKRYASTVIDQARVELQRLLEERPVREEGSASFPCEPAD